MRHATVHHGERGRLLALLAPLLVGLGLHVGAPLARAADMIYWTAEGAGTIRVGNLDGMGTAATLFGSEASPCGVAINPAAGKVYWTNFGGGLRVANLNGSGTAATLFDGSSSLCGVAINPATNKIYWADFGNDRIRVGNLDGTGTAATLFSTLDAPSGVAIDPAAGKIYWTDQFDDTVEVANLNGTGTPAVLFGPTADDDNPIGLAIDTAAGKIYWTALSSGKVRVGNQDGTGSPSTLFGSESTPGGVAIDSAANKIYWDTFSGGGAIRVANLDGSGSPSTLFGSEGSPLLAALLRAPVGTAPPMISGTPEIGEELTCSQGDWADDLLAAFLFRAPRTFAYQWQKDGNDIGGETNPTFTPTMTGSYTCRVTATNDAGSAEQTSATTPVTTTTTTTSTTTTTTTVVTTTTTTLATTTTTLATTTTSTTAATTTTTLATTTTTTTATSTTTTTTLSPVCGPTPAVGCRLALPGAAVLQIKDSTHDTSDQFKWKWARGAATATSDFLDPVGGSATYRVCVYDGSANSQPLMQMDVPPGGTCGNAPCWKVNGAKGFSYKNRAGTPNGLTSMKLKAGVTGKASVQAKGKGIDLPTPALGLTLPVTAQLLIKSGSTTECWQTKYTTASVDSTERFKAKGP